MKKYMVLAYNMHTGDSKVLETISSQNIKLARQFATAKHLGIITSAPETGWSLAIVTESTYDRCYKR